MKVDISAQHIDCIYSRPRLLERHDGRRRDLRFVRPRAHRRRNLTALNTLDAKVSRVMQDIEDGAIGMANDQRLNKRSADDAQIGDGGRESKRQRKQQWQYDDDKQFKEIRWGSAITHGIWAEDDAARIAFGNTIADYGGKKPDLATNCVACYAPGKLGVRDKWCWSPAKCWKAGGDNAHARADGFEDADCKANAAHHVSNRSEWARSIASESSPCRCSFCT